MLEVDNKLRLDVGVNSIFISNQINICPTLEPFWVLLNAKSHCVSGQCLMAMSIWRRILTNTADVDIFVGFKF